MTEAFPGHYIAGDYQEQKTPETEPKTEHPADGESQADGLPAVNPEALREDGDVVSGRMGNLALEASGVAAPDNDRSEAAVHLIKRRLLLVQKIQTKPARIYGRC